MKIRSAAFLVLCVLFLNMTGMASNDTRRGKMKKRQTAALVALLPASDGIATLDAKRMFETAVPTILSSNQAMLAAILAKLNEIENKTGIDLRKFDQVAVGVAVKRVSATEYDFDPVAVARGDISVGALIGVVKLASNGAYRQEMVGGHTVYVFTVKEAAKKTVSPTANSKIAGTIEKALDGLTHEIAVSKLDQRTLVFGSLERVRETLEAKTKIASDVAALLPNSETAIMTFAMRSPGGMGIFLPHEYDELGKNIDSIRYAAGSLDVASTGTSVRMMARTAKPEQAESLLDTLEGLQMLGKAFLGNSKRADQKVYGRMVQNAKFARTGTDITLELQVPQSDIDILVAGVK